MFISLCHSEVGFESHKKVVYSYLDAYDMKALANKGMENDIFVNSLSPIHSP